MQKENIAIFLIIIAIGIFLFILKYEDITKITGSTIKEQADYKIVTKIVDGDTIIVEGGETIRLLGVDTDEKGQRCYDAGKQKLQELTLNKEVKLEKDMDDADKYGRKLRYIIIGNSNINEITVKEGFAVARFPTENGKYKEQIIQAEQYAKDNQIGCKWNKNWEAKKVIINACDSKNYVGLNAEVKGIIKEVKETKNVIYLNLENKYPEQCLTLAIFKKEKFTKFNYENKNVIAKGKIIEYNGKPEIIINEPTQLKILD